MAQAALVPKRPRWASQRSGAAAAGAAVQFAVAGVPRRRVVGVAAARCCCCVPNEAGACVLSPASSAP